MLDGRYRLINYLSGLTLSLAGDYTIEQYWYIGLPSQEWVIKYYADRGNYTIFTPGRVINHSMAVLGVVDSELANDAGHFDTAEGNWSTRQQFIFHSNAVLQTYRIECAGSAKVLDVQSDFNTGSPYDNPAFSVNAHITQWTSNGGINQDWLLVRLGDA